eukprot:3724491-Prymnesium_polylepis.1
MDEQPSSDHCHPSEAKEPESHVRSAGNRQENGGGGNEKEVGEHVSRCIEVSRLEVSRHRGASSWRRAGVEASRWPIC